MDITTFFKATLDYFKYLSEYPTDYTREKKFVELVQNNNSVLEVLIQKMWQPNKNVVAGQVIWSPNMPNNKRAIVTTAGVTNGVEPNWDSDNVIDGNVTYTMYSYIESKNIKILDAFPIGSIYISTNVNPSNFFGGEWEEIANGQILIGTGGKYVAGESYGEDEHTLITSELPSHNHGGTIGGGSHNHTASCSNNGAHTHTIGKGTSTKDDNGPYPGNTFGPSGTKTITTDSAGAHSHTITVNTSASHSHTFTGTNIGGSQAHNNIMPFMSVHIWKRIA